MKTETHGNHPRLIVWDNCAERASQSAYEMREAITEAKRKAGLLKHRLSKTTLK